MKCILDVFCQLMILCCSLHRCQRCKVCYIFVKVLLKQWSYIVIVKKCMVIRIGLRCKYECEPLQLCEITLLFVNQMKYLGIYIRSAEHFKLAYDNCNVSLCFNLCFNAIYSKSQGHNSEIVCVELLKRYCLPIVLYATEAVYPDKTSLKCLDKLVDTAVHKIFKNFDEQITFDIRKYVGLRNLSR